MVSAHQMEYCGGLQQYVIHTRLHCVYKKKELILNVYFGMMLSLGKGVII